MRNQPIPLIGEFYADETRPWSQQDVLNWLPCASESQGTRTPVILQTPPGLRLLVDIDPLPARGVYQAEGRLFTVVGQTLYQISSDGAATSRGTIPGTSRVRFAHNQITNGNQVLIVTGSSGYVYNTTTQALTRITDAGYPGAFTVVFIDGYLIQIEPAGRYAFHSDLADALEYNTLDRFTSEVAPDKLVSMAVSNNELILFSETTTEFFENTGALQQPFKSKRITMQRGCAGRFTAIQMDNTVYWLGDDGQFYLLDGYSPRRISTRPIEQMIRNLNWGQAFAFTWEDSGHSVCYWTFPDGFTIGYDAAQPVGLKWHRRASYGLARWRVGDMAVWNKRWIASDFQYGRLWELDWEYILEGSDRFISECTSPVIHDNQNRVLMPRFELIVDTGSPTLPPLTIAGDLLGGFVGEVVSYQYTASGGVLPYGNYTIASGALPAGLTMSAAGLVTGTLTTAGGYSWTVRVTDADSVAATLADSSATIKSISQVFAVNLYTGNGVLPRTLSTLDMGGGGSFLARRIGADWPHLFCAPTGGAAWQKDFSGALGSAPSTTALTATGVTLNEALLNVSAVNFFGYSFGNYPGFAEALTWVGNGAASRVIPHALAAAVGNIFVAPQTSATFIDVFHASLGATKYMKVNGPSQPVISAAAWGDTEPTATGFTVGSRYNAIGVNYSAQVLAQNGDHIKCGSYVGNGTANGPLVALGWQPQMLIIKGITAGSNYYVVDTARTPGLTGIDSLAWLSASNSPENVNDQFALTADGFQPKDSSGGVHGNKNGVTYVYVAVRAP